MSCRIFLVGVVFVGAAVFSSALTAQVQSGHHTGLIVLPFRAVETEETLVRGQTDAVGKKASNFFDKVKKTLSNIIKDEEEIDHSRDRDMDKGQDSPRVQSIPMTPPKPVTSQDIRKSVDQADAVPEKRSPPPTAQAVTVSKSAEPVRESRETREVVVEIPKSAPPAESVASSNNDSIYRRLESIRSQVFVDTLPETVVVPTTSSSVPVASRTSAAPSVPSKTVSSSSPTTVDRRPPPTSPTFAQDSTFRERSSTSRSVQSEVEERPSVAAPTRRIAMSVEPMEDQWENDDIEPIRTQITERREVRDEMKPLSGVDVVRRSSESAWNRSETTSTKPRQSLETEEIRTEASSVAKPTTSLRTEVVSAKETESTSRSQATFSSSSDREKALLVSPLIELETIGASKAIVGQESSYRIRVLNRGGAVAEQVVLTVEIPNWIDVLPPDVSAGTTSIVGRGPNNEIRDFVWKITKIDPKNEEQIVLHLVPRQRQTVDLKIRYDFRKPLAVAKIIVQEPTLEMELLGPGEVLWGSKVNYKLLVRNTGNGDAENVKLELLQTGSDMKSCELPLLKAGEEQMIDVDVWTGKQDHVDINIQATGAYDLTATAMKRVVVMRPDLSVQIESPEMQFVGNQVEFTVRTKNNGNATAKNVELIATIPLGAKYVSNTAAGRLTPQNQVIWNIDAIPSSGEFVASVVCEMKREGQCKLEAAVNDKNGLLANGIGNINIEAVADLKMQLENPQGPIEVGQEAVFVITVTNRGTKTAEDVEVVAAFARGLEPFGIEGGNGTMNDGQVIFDKIPTISAGQTLTLKVKGKADRPGNHRIRAEVICQAVNAHLVYEQATFFYQKQKGKSAFMAESPNTSGFSNVEQPATPLSIQHSATSQPLKNAPPTAIRTLEPLR